MDSRNNPFVSEQEAEYENSPENSEDSPASGMLSDSKMTSTSSPRRSRRAMQKRVVSVPIKDVDSSRHKGEMSTPPSDSWAWRKYGQKPIKGSPYPRGYYRCSSSKGCPARKQVERSRADPTMLMVTYSCEHNHPWPAASKNNNNRNHHHRNQNQENNINPTTKTPPMSLTASSPNVTTTSNNSDDDQISTCIFTMDEEFTTLGTSFYSEFAWFTNFETTSSTVLESPILGRDGSIGDADIATIFSTKEEDESLFADLEELPECSLVFRRGVAEESRRLPLCRTTAG